LSLFAYLQSVRKALFPQLPFLAYTP
jgi:hypothetical protein